MNRILVIRGGAIGDFVLTLPAIKALRDAFPAARLEILGYKHIAALAENRFYADAVRSIEYGALSAFFARDGELNDELRSYFASFDLVISYLFDPDGIFQRNLQRAGVQTIVCGPAKIRSGAHASHQLAAPLHQLHVAVTDYAARIFLTADDTRFADEFLRGLPAKLVTVHIGSGSPRKNWPIENWIELGDSLISAGRCVVVVSGEADQSQAEKVRIHWKDSQVVRFATNLPLPHLAAVLARSTFVGHDSGVSHLAAAAGANSIVLFGPTDPEVWAPLGPNVRIMRAPQTNLQLLLPETVMNAVNMSG